LKGGFERFRLLRRYCQTPAFQSELRKCNHVIHIDQLASAFHEICHQVEYAFPDIRVTDTDKLLYEFQALFEFEWPRSSMVSMGVSKQSQRLCARPVPKPIHSRSQFPAVLLE
jgi:hypothetical protein